MRTLVIAAALVGVVSLLGFSMVSAHGEYGYGPGNGYGNCGDGHGYCNNRYYNGQDKEKMNSFLEGTKEARKQVAIKRSERRALMKQDNPDEKKVAKLTGEIYDLKNMLDEKAREIFGDNPPFGYKHTRKKFDRCGRGSRSL